MAKELNWDNVLQVSLHEAKPNPLFSEAQRATVRFLRYSRAVPCAECGRKSKSHWTSLFSFEAMDAQGRSFVLRSKTGKVHPPLAPVCGRHPMAPKEYDVVDKDGLPIRKAKEVKHA